MPNSLYQKKYLVYPYHIKGTTQLFTYFIHLLNLNVSVNYKKWRTPRQSHNTKICSRVCKDLPYLIRGFPYLVKGHNLL
jgi:hypothetical protein